MTMSAKVVGWRVWYSDRAISSRDSRWEDLPADDVQCVVLYHEGGTRRIMQGNDYYWRWQSDFGMVYAHGDSPPDPERYPGATVLRGKWTTDDNLARIEREAMGSSWL